MRDATLIVASARLPVRLDRFEGDWRANPSPGGLATALRAVAKRRDFKWIGLPGASVPEAEHGEVSRTLAEVSGSVPIFIEPEEFEGFYGEFSNRVLWPLFHNLPGPRKFSADAWRLYRDVNRRFADTIAEHAGPGDLVWVHDYQLALVPLMLRERLPECAIGFFLHIPFPSSETYRALPVREDILRGMLGADLVGFHSYEYVSHFCAACLRVLGLDSEPEWVTLPGRKAYLSVLPIGIEPAELAELGRTPAAEGERERLKERYGGHCIITGVDRADYTKGLSQKFHAYEELLADHPELHGEVVLIQVAAPSRTDVAEYQALKRELDEMVGRINGRFGTLHWTPLVYINQNVSRARLVALYEAADIALVTPVRDGMNLVALEYIASRADRPGTLILSEFTGAAACLSGARLVNPHNPSQIAEELAEAIRQPEPAGPAYQQMRDFVLQNTSTSWAERFMQQLQDVARDTRSHTSELDLRRESLADEVRGARRPLLLLDYDGTLVPHVARPRDAVPGPRVRGLLVALAKRATVYVVSGRPANELETFLGDLPLGLVCEHGVAIKPAGGAWSDTVEIDVDALRETVEPVFRDFTQRTPGSRIEHKTASLAWHYRRADPQLGRFRARSLLSVLDNRLAGQPLSVLLGSRVIEVRHVRVSKGTAATTLIERHPETDLIVCAGNDRTDEDMFEVVIRSGREPTIVCAVGGNSAIAPYWVASPTGLLEQLATLAEMWAA